MKNIIFCWCILFVFEVMADLQADHSLFLEAVANNDLRLASQLLHQGADVNQKDPQSYTPLMIAAGLGNPQMVELLLVAGADVTILDGRMGASALHKAAQGGVVDVARLLLQRGAFIDLQAPTLGHTPLIDAVWHKNTAMVKYLLSQNAKMYLQTHAGATAVNFAKRDSLTDIIKAFEEEEQRRIAIVEKQLLMKAVIAKDLEMVKKLLQQPEVDVNEKAPMIGNAYDGHTPLLVAAREGYTEIVRELLRYNANPKLVDGLIKATPGHKAGYKGHPEIARLLTKNGLEIDAQGPYNGYTALHDAVWHGHTETAKVLIDAGAKIDLIGHDGRTPLRMAKDYGYTEIVKLLEEKSQQQQETTAITKFIYDWFSLFDRQADSSYFLPYLNEKSLLMQFPDHEPLLYPQHFVEWYKNIKSSIQNNIHEIHEIKIEAFGLEIYEIRLKIHWRGKTYQGEEVEVMLRQWWEIKKNSNGSFVIQKYLVTIL